MTQAPGLLCLNYGTVVDRKEAMLTKDIPTPVVGMWRIRIVRGGPWVPVKIWDEAETDEAGDLLEDEKLMCHVNGTKRNPWNGLMTLMLGKSGSNTSKHQKGKITFIACWS